MLRPYQREDLPFLVSVADHAKLYPWALQNFENCWLAGYPGWVLSAVDELFGFVLVMDAPDVVHILNMAVKKEYQRQGYGKQLLEQVITFANALEKAIFLEVRHTNYPAIQLYRQYGFLEVGRRRDYYPAEIGREDALVMMKRFFD